MKTTIIIDNIHSVLDVITNSSSELFVINDETSIEVVEDMLQFMLKQYNEMAAKGVFGKWAKKGDPKKMSDVMSVGILRDEDITDDEYSWGYEKPENVGKIVIESTSDNTIPWEIIEWIESAFSSRRWHLG